ncbi:isoprenoid synthase domain-containing protein [Poronia punctata]|nr:isoprenoid synthase domain-containing protein [Poronia punctata]
MELSSQTTVTSPWSPLKSTLRPLLESIYPHQRRLLTSTPIISSPTKPEPAISPRPVIEDAAEQQHPTYKTAQEATRERWAGKPSPQGNSSSSSSQTKWTEQKEKIIRSPYDYVAAEPGKEFRTLLLQAFNVWLEIPQESLDIIADVIRMLHTASLLIDDIQDNSSLRRGRPVAHNIYGVAQTINAGNYVYFLALRELQKLPRNTAKATEIYTTEMLYLHRGQGMELYWRDTLTCPTEADYLEMVSNKTGGLFRLAVRLMQSQSDTQFDCVPLAELLGRAFQIADDYKNLANADYEVQKGLCDDLTEGKFSFPIIHCVRAEPDDHELLHILAQRTTDADTKRYAVRRMERTGSLEYTKELVGSLLARTREEAEGIQPGSGKGRGILALLGKLELK